VRSYPRDTHYAENQRNYNYRHSNGCIETEGDIEAAELLADRLEEFIPITPRYILVLGCRTGYESRALAARFDALTVGVDIVEDFIVAAAKRTPTMLQDMHTLALPDEAFDLSVAVGTLEHCYDPKKAVLEISRVTRSYAYLTADLERDRGAYKSHYSFSDDVDEWLKLFQECGFQVVKHVIEQGTVSQGVHAYLRK
jgi:SAM-dependent methyltransferase